ncbi:MAG TPA: hypothetical protein PLC88_03680 [Syntrophomonas sp.]|nr:hypothetical protein [Syntrophomonas sp.]HRW13243.1 hypothetical protein [Syntrophomonas sp.]
MKRRSAAMMKEGIKTKVFLNGTEMQFVEGGYQYVFVKPYQKYTEKTVNKENGDKMHLELYDNGVQIRTLVTQQEVSTIINRDVAVDTVNNKIYILEPDSQVRKNEDGSVELI